MDRGGGYSQSLAHSFSLPSLVEGSEPISEAEEFVEMKSLRKQGDKALKIKDYSGAIRYYNEALEIDEQNSDVLLARATACIEMGDFISAQRDTDSLISQDTENAKAYKVQGRALKHLHQYKEALSAFLTSLDLDPDNADELTDEIADVAAKFCNISEEMMESLKEMDSYKKLSEVGVCLFQAKKYKVCIKILDASQKFQTNQKGITMRILLTSANAHSALKHTEKAISLYQECLATAIATHDQVYQTKALVNIATLYLENHDTHQAIIYYEKLLHLEAELLAETGDDDDVLPDFWTKELQCGLHLNLSIAYKAIGDMHSAIKHAKQYVVYIEKYNFKGKLKAESYHNTGMLNEILGNYNDAINNYNKYLQECKNNGDKKGMAQAYGCLGSVYAALRHWMLSITYHEQYVTMASRFEDKRMTIIANEMLADTLMLKGDYDRAVSAYETMMNSCIRTDYRTRATCMCKLGHAYRALKKYQYSLYFYEQAADLGEDFDFPEIETLSHYNVACIHQKSTQHLDLEKALKYFRQLVPYFETKIREHTSEDSHCPDEYHIQLQECYDGIQSVLVKLGNKEECLQYAEGFRKRSLTQTHNYQASAMTSQSHSAPWDMWMMDRISRVVSQQNSTVMYYSLLTDHLLLWVLQPGIGLARFYSKKAKGDENMIKTIESLLLELREDCNWKKLQNECEARALPLKSTELEIIRRRNLSLNQAITQAPGEKNTAETPKLEEETKSEKSTARRLYDLLFSPVEDILSKLPKQSPLVIIPDKLLHHCPFNVLQDFLNRYAFQRFRITCLPNLLLLDKVVANEMNHLRELDELTFERHQHKKGGVFKYSHKFSGQDFSNIAVNSGESHDVVNPKRVAHPRLLTRPMRVPMVEPHPGVLSKQPTMTEEEFKKHSPWRHPHMIAPIPGVLPKQQTMYEKEFKQHSPWRSPRSPRVLQGIAESYRSSDRTTRSPGTPTPLDRMLSFQTYTTLTTQTSTGTDITTSHNTITQFKQVSSKDRCLVFGNPKLPESLALHGKEWRPGAQRMVSAMRECVSVATVLDVDPITGSDATKARFMKDVEQAAIIHIVTYGCWQEGLLVFSPTLTNTDEGMPREESYLVSVDDILGLRLTAQLVVINTGYTPYRKDTLRPGYLLPSALLAAGAQCVLTSLWPLPDLAVEKFYSTFYLSLQDGAMVSTGVQTAIQALKDDDRYESQLFWSAFILIGKDVEVNINEIRHAMLDQTIDQSEAEIQEETGKEFLNPKPVLQPVVKKVDNLKSLQTYMCTLLQNHSKEPNVLPELIDLMDSALKRLHTEDNNKQTTNLSDDIMTGSGALDLLKLLGFHFQARGSTLDSPYVVYPHWNKDELLVPSYDALRASIEMSESPDLVQALCGVLPISQDNISLIVDLLSVTKHAPEIQLKVSDLSVRPLWVNIKLKAVLAAIGFHQIGMLLNFNRTPENRQLMGALFQFLLSVSLYKSQVLLYKLDVNLLGTYTESKASSDFYPELSKLPTLTPILLPRHQLRMSTPWLSMTEKPSEMEEKVRLARTRTDLDENFKDYLERAKTWHQMTVVAQLSEEYRFMANEALDRYGRPRSSPNKVKVIPGATASMERVPVKREVVLLNPEVDQRRDYAHYVYQQRVQTIDTRRKNEVLKLYLPYVNSL